MSADFWAGYWSGAVGIIVGNPLDIIKLRYQTQVGIVRVPIAQTSSTWLKGTAAPILGYGALNAILFVSYNRCETILNKIYQSSFDNLSHPSLAVTWVAGALGGLATWVVSAPTELIKCRVQISSPTTSSWTVARHIWQTDGLKGLYFGGLVTALRDTIGYGFYFWAYELANRCWSNTMGNASETPIYQDAPRIILCGGLAGVVTWASVFPLDVIKSRVQTQPYDTQATVITPLQQCNQDRLGAWDFAKKMYGQGGIRPFFRGIAVCSTRAFIVNAVQWVVYEGVMHQMGQGRKHRSLKQDDNGEAF